MQHRRVMRAYQAFEAALAHASTEGLRDLHEALQTGLLAVQGAGKAHLVRGSWGTLGSETTSGTHSACPLNALFLRSARAHGGGQQLAIWLAAKFMGREGYRPDDFYGAWDAGFLPAAELRGRVERHIERRLNPPPCLPGQVAPASDVLSLFGLSPQPVQGVH